MIGVILLIFFILYIINFYKKVKSLPPGPMPIPFFGNLLSIDKKRMHLWIHEQSKIYGNIYTIWLPKPQVVFSDYESINESLVKNGDNFTGRNIHTFPDKGIHDKINVGVIFSEGEEWKDQRRLSLQILRNFGMSRTIMQDKIHLVIQDFWDYVDNLEDRNNVNIEKIIQLSVGNVINLLLFGFMYSHNDKDNEEFFEFAKALEEAIKASGSWESKVLVLFPSIQKIPFVRDLLYTRITRLHEKKRHLNRIKVQKCMESYNPDDEPPNFIHAVMREIESIDSKYSYLNSDHLEAMVLDFWAAGMETSSTTLKWFILLVMKHLDIQKKLHDEIDEVIGRDQLVQLSDRVKMPYMNAFITEGQRYLNIVPYVIPHRCTKDTVINGHLIKKDTSIQPFIWAANVEEKYFKDPFTFNPNRFLDSEGNFKVEHEHMSFGKGKRICAGKSLADTELFLFFTSFLQKYKFTHPNGPVDLSCDFGGVLIPRKYTCNIEKR